MKRSLHIEQPLKAAALAVAVFASLSQPVVAQVAGSARLGTLQIENSRVAMGWSAKESILGQDLFNESGETIGKVEDLIVDRARNVSYLIVGAGGFVGAGRHAVAILASQVEMRGDRMVLPGATRTSLAALPPFVYAPVTRSHSSIVARAERDMDKAGQRISLLDAPSGPVSDAQLQRRAEQITALQERRDTVEEAISAMNAAVGADWKAAELEVGKASARLRLALRSQTPS